jgi:hypothetical protein
MATLAEFQTHMSALIDREIERLVEQIAWIDGRLLELDNSEESEAERKLLMILRRHLMKDLYELAGFVWDSEEEVEDVAPTVSSVVLEYADVSS